MPFRKPRIPRVVGHLGGLPRARRSSPFWGVNTIEVYARSTDGAERTVTRTGMFLAQKLAPREQADLARLLARSKKGRAEGTVEIETEP